MIMLERIARIIDPEAWENNSRKVDINMLHYKQMMARVKAKEVLDEIAKGPIQK